MACFLVTVAEAAVVSTVNATQKKKGTTEKSKNPFVKKLNWLPKFLWGGSFLLAFEHVWHGEVTPWFTFLTAASNPADAAEMLHEMGTAGVCMALLVTGFWVAAVLVTNAIEKRPDRPAVKAV